MVVRPGGINTSTPVPLLLNDVPVPSDERVADGGDPRPTRCREWDLRDLRAGARLADVDYRVQRRTVERQSWATVVGAKDALPVSWNTTVPGVRR